MEIGKKKLLKNNLSFILEGKKKLQSLKKVNKYHLISYYSRHPKKGQGRKKKCF